MKWSSYFLFSGGSSGFSHSFLSPRFACIDKKMKYQAMRFSLRTELVAWTKSTIIVEYDFFIEPFLVNACMHNSTFYT